MDVLVKRIYIFLVFMLALHGALYGATYSTRTTANGEWMNASVWNGTAPGTYTLNGNTSDIYHIYGRISVGTPSANQTLTISKGLLSIEDTLIIYGNLVIGNNGDLTITNGAVLIVYGDVSVANQVTIAANSYFVIMGDLSKSGSQGTFTSDDHPSNVYIGGSITGNWSTTGSNDVLNCNLAAEHDSSGCNYGNPVDLQETPISDFVNSNCSRTPVITAMTSNSPVIVGATLTINASGNQGTGTLPITYNWTGPSGYTATGSSLSRSPAATSMSGYYHLTLINQENCATKDSISVQIISCGSLNGGIVGTNQIVCVNNPVSPFTSTSGASPGTYTYQWYSSINSTNPSSGTWIAIAGATGTTYTSPALTQTTYYYRKATETSGCTTASNVITVTVYPKPVTGPTHHISNGYAK